MYEDLHDDVTELLEGTGLAFTFYDRDNGQASTKHHDTSIMGHFVCKNPACHSTGWSSKKIATTIRLYRGMKYNAKVYHQRCKSCNWLSQPQLDDSYAERVVYWLKRWHGREVEGFQGFHKSKGPHDSRLCEDCKAGHCSESNENDWAGRLERYVALCSTTVKLLTYVRFTL